MGDSRSAQAADQFDLRKINRNILVIAVTQIFASFVGLLAQELSVTIEQYKFGAEAIAQNIIYLPLMQVMAEKLPAALIYFFGADIFASVLQNDKERCETVLTAYYELSLYFSLATGAIFCIVISVFAERLGISEEYRTSALVGAMLGPLFNALNSVLQLRYLAEFRLFMLLVRGCISPLLQLGLEYFLYTVVRNPRGNQLTMCAYVASNICLIAWQAYIAAGHTLYSFEIRNAVVIDFKKVLIPTRELILIEMNVLFQALFKFIIDITLPVAVLIAQAMIRNSFTDQSLIFYSLADFYMYLYVFGIVRAIPEGFLYSYTFWITMCVKQQCYAKRHVYVIRIFAFALFFGALAGAILYLAREPCCKLLFNFKNADILGYFRHEPQRFIYTTIVSIVMGVLDIFQLVGVFDAMSNNMRILLVLMAFTKMLMCGLAAKTIYTNIGNKADYLWVLIFADGFAMVLSLFYTATVTMKYRLKHKHGQKLESKK